MTVAEWEAVFKRQKWGAWPEIRFVEWFMRTFGGAGERERERIRVLELGCGAGAQLCFLQSEGFQAYGVDGSRTALNQAKRNLREFDGPRAILWEADLISFDVPSYMVPNFHERELGPEALAPGAAYERLDYGGFDCIVDVCTLQHIPPGPNAQIVQRALRWLRPGGWLFSKWRAQQPAGERLPPPAAPGVPEPYPLDRGHIHHVFPGFERHVTLERVMHESGEETAHWIITGRKV